MVLTATRHLLVFQTIRESSFIDMNKQIVIVEYKNGPTVGYRFNSDVKLDINEIHKWLIDNDDFNEQRDSFTIIDDVIDVEYRKNK